MEISAKEDFRDVMNSQSISSRPPIGKSPTTNVFLFCKPFLGITNKRKLKNVTPYA